ncbi:MAG: hypothetical protein SGPRY_004310 [Prymnesium sp.]
MQGSGEESSLKAGRRGSEEEGAATESAKLRDASSRSSRERHRRTSIGMSLSALDDDCMYAGDIEPREYQKQRWQLRQDPKVKAVLEKWWAAALRSRVSPEAPHDEFLRKEDYLNISRCMYKALIQACDEAHALAEAEYDWENDSQGEGVLGKDRFLGAVFGLTELWTSGVEADECCSFLEAVLQCVADQQLDGTHKWKVPFLIRIPHPPQLATTLSSFSRDLLGHPHLTPPPPDVTQLFEGIPFGGFAMARPKLANVATGVVQSSTALADLSPSSRTPSKSFRNQNSLSSLETAAREVRHSANSTGLPFLLSFEAELPLFPSPSDANSKPFEPIFGGASDDRSSSLTSTPPSTSPDHPNADNQPSSVRPTRVRVAEWKVRAQRRADGEAWARHVLMAMQGLAPPPSLPHQSGLSVEAQRAAEAAEASLLTTPSSDNLSFLKMLAEGRSPMSYAEMRTSSELVDGSWTKPRHLIPNRRLTPKCSPPPCVGHKGRRGQTRGVFERLSPRSGRGKHVGITSLNLDAVTSSANSCEAKARQVSAGRSVMVSGGRATHLRLARELEQASAERPARESRIMKLKGTMTELRASPAENMPSLIRELAGHSRCDASLESHLCSPPYSDARSATPSPSHRDERGDSPSSDCAAAVLLSSSARQLAMHRCPAGNFSAEQNREPSIGGHTRAGSKRGSISRRGKSKLISRGSVGTVRDALTDDSDSLGSRVRDDILDFYTASEGIPEYCTASKDILDHYTASNHVFLDCSTASGAVSAPRIYLGGGYSRHATGTRSAPELAPLSVSPNAKVEVAARPFHQTSHLQSGMPHGPAVNRRWMHTVARVREVRPSLTIAAFHATAAHAATSVVSGETVEIETRPRAKPLDTRRKPEVRG